MLLLGYSLMTVLHESVFSFENICNLYNLLLKNYDTLYILLIEFLKQVCIALYHSLQKISIIKKNSSCDIGIK